LKREAARAGAVGRLPTVARTVGLALAASWLALAAVSVFGLLIINMIYSAPESPGLDDPWRWATILVAFLLSLWNVASAYRAYESSGLFSMVGFLHAWSFFAFSFPALEMTYRYDSLKMMYWETKTNEPLLLAGVLVLGVFQALFFFALGREPHGAIRRVVSTARAGSPDRRIALVFFLLVVPLAVTRFEVVLDLGLQGAVETMITRDPYTDRLSQQQSNLGWLLTNLFPIYTVPLLCLGIKRLVRHPSTSGALLYLAALLIGVAGVIITGGRSELVYVLFTVLIFMYVQGYRKLGQYKLLILPIVFLALTLFAVAQARHGADNALSGLAQGTRVGYDYSAGDVTQTLGLGRFDAMLMILDNSGTEGLLWGKSYAYAVAEGLNTTLFPKIILGDWLPRWHVSDQIMGYWVFGEPIQSALPSAPGELLLNFGFVGVMLGAVVLGLAARFLLRWLLRFNGSVEFAWIVTVWGLARFLSDDSYLLAQYGARAWVPVILLTFLLLGRKPAR
jgi:oligosaccharide repeat unit polymerase